jgi:5'-nucleotidase (lipoprotein e(P4) family)
VATAQALGVEVFYVTNRECKERAAGGPRCPQEADTRRNLVAAGFPPTDAAHLLLKGEVDAWTSEKSNRRALIAQTHRIVMLVGDDLGDFLSTARDMPLDERAAWVDLAEDWWGTRWIIVPNPIYGSWLKQLGEQPLDHLVALDAIVDAIHQERACAQASGGTGVGSPKAPAAPAAPAAAHAKAASDKIRVATWNLNNLQ